MSDPVNRLQLELRVIGAVITRGDALHELPANFSAAAFRREELRSAFEAMHRLAARGDLPAGPIDTALLAAEARLNDSAAKLLPMAESEADGPARAPAAAHARALLERTQRETLAELFQSAAASLREKTPDEVASEVMARLLDINRPERPEVVSYKAAALDFLEQVEKAKKGKGLVLRTGFSDIDRVLWIRKGNLIVLAARPKVGKTTLALQIAGNVARRGEHVLVHSLEMGRDEVIAVDMAREAKMDSRVFFDRDRRITPEEEARCTKAADAVIGEGDGFLHFNDSYFEIGAIQRITEKMHRKHGLVLVVVDYLQLVKAMLGKGASREQQVSFVSRGLKEMAARLGVPVLALSQLNREAEKKNARGGGRGGRRGRDDDDEGGLLLPPELHELRESGAIEQDANAVCFLHNPYAKSPDPHQRKRGPFEFIVAAQRMAPSGSVRLFGDLERSAFRPYQESAGAHFIQDPREVT